MPIQQDSIDAPYQLHLLQTYKHIPNELRAATAFGGNVKMNAEKGNHQGSYDRKEDAALTKRNYVLIYHSHPQIKENQMFLIITGHLSRREIDSREGTGILMKYEKTEL